jgi:hypothetical protein
VQYLTIWDLILTPFYLVILILIAKRQCNKRYPVGHALRAYFMKGLYVKFAGAIFVGLIYQYYYGGGDTFNYFKHAQIINSAFDDSFFTWLKVLTRQPLQSNPEVYAYASQMEWYGDPATYSVPAIGAILGIFCGTNYMPIAILFAYFSFTGVWAMFRTFANLYPKLHKELAVAFLFIPSTFVWGSGIFKDTLCLFGLGWMVYTTFRIFVNKDFSLRNILMFVFSFYLLATVKLYILLAFLPALSLWLLLSYSYKIKTAGVRFIVTLSFIGLSFVGFLFFTGRFANEMNRYSLEKVAETAASTRGWIYFSSGDEGSAYDLGEFEPTVVGMLSKFPQAVVVTLFRPFLWESKKIIVLLSALEALIFLFFTLKAIVKNKSRIFSRITKDPNLMFCLVFSLIFAFAVGISTYNFGTLSRYKIPCIPFYAGLLVILIYQNKENIKTTESFQLKSARKEPAFA